MPTPIKICGITRLKDALLAVELGAAALGFNFYKPSPRYIEPREASKIIQKLPPFVTAVGVFANEKDAARVRRVARGARVRAVQLHGPAPSLAGRPFKNFLLIRAVAVGEKFNPRRLKKLACDAILLDTADAALFGGTGKSFDWNFARNLSEHLPVILAGGLTPENVGRAIRKVRPFAVDVASGVESSPGVKDEKKLRKFFAAVARAGKA